MPSTASTSAPRSCTTSTREPLISATSRPTALSATRIALGAARLKAHLIDRAQLRHQRAIGFRRPVMRAAEPRLGRIASAARSATRRTCRAARARRGRCRSSARRHAGGSRPRSAFELGGALHRPGAGGSSATDRPRPRRQARRRSSRRDPANARRRSASLRNARKHLSQPEKHGHTAPRMELSVRIERWPIAGAFAISRGRKTEAVVVVAELNDGIHRGRGESVPYARYGETPDGVAAPSKPCVRHYSRASTAKRSEGAWPRCCPQCTRLCLLGR